MRLFRYLVLLTAGLGFSLGCAPERELDPVPPQGSDIELAAETRSIEGIVPRNATFAGLLQSHGLANDRIAAIVEQTREVFDPRRLRAQNAYRLVTEPDGRLRQLEYHIDSDSFLQIRQAASDDRFDVAIVPYVKQRAVISLSGAIDATRSSLVAAVDDAGEQVLLAIAMADVLGGEIDFNNDLRRGDSFSVVFERFLREDHYDDYGNVLAAEFNNDGRRVRAVRFTPPGGDPGYYDDQGRSLKRMFLRSPLRFEPRITSRFSRSRMHPILGERRAHLGVDYGAATGTPVIAVANGTVVSAARSGGSGRMVRLRHAGGYETYYLHLSSFANGMRRGARVAQGQLIGRVGSTGLATGPHLDYRLKKNGTFVDPLVEHRKMPPGDPIPAEHLDAFRAERDRVTGLFVAPSTGTAALSADGAPLTAPSFTYSPLYSPSTPSLS